MAQQSQLVATRAPHLKIRVETTLQIMSEVMVALLPATLFGVYLFGLEALAVVAAAVAAAVLTEALAERRLAGFRELIGDGSAALTGLLLALTLPPTLGPGYAAAGAVSAILFGKILQGGLGRNLFNPALVGRAIMLAVWPGLMTAYVSPVDGATTATPLVADEFGAWEVFVGTVPGSIGETSVPLLLIGGVFLLARGRIEWRIPVFFILATAVTAVLFGAEVSLHLFGGGLMLAAVYMATDWVTSPISESGQILFGIGCGIGTVLIRELGAYPEGVTYAILLMNACTPLFDRFLKRKALGEA